MKWFRKLFLRSDAWSAIDLKRRLRPLRFRVADERDFATCEDLHAQNEAFGVPTVHRRFYREALRTGEMLTLMVEEEGRVVATCGLQWYGEAFAWLCYGLVRPERHRCGIGTAMLLARIGLLPRGVPDQKIGLAAVESSLSFYTRFGFKLLGRADFPDGNRYPIAVMGSVHTGLIECSRDILREAKIVVPEVVIPAKKEPNQSLEPTTLLGTSAAEPPLVPSRVVAHL